MATEKAPHSLSHGQESYLLDHFPGPDPDVRARLKTQRTTVPWETFSDAFVDAESGEKRGFHRTFRLDGVFKVS